MAIFWFVRILGSASRVEFPVSPSKHASFAPRLLYSSSTPLLRKFYPSEDRLSSRCLTSVIERELVSHGTIISQLKKY